MSLILCDTACYLFSISILLSFPPLFCLTIKSVLPRLPCSWEWPWTKFWPVKCKRKCHLAASGNFSKTQHANPSASPSHLTPTSCLIGGLIIWDLTISVSCSTYHVPSLAGIAVLNSQLTFHDLLQASKIHSDSFWKTVFKQTIVLFLL